jgi:hypothetical protein
VADGVEDGVFCQVVEQDTANELALCGKLISDMPGNGFTLPVRVGRQVDVFGAFGCLFQLGNNFLLGFDHLVGGFKIVLHINAQGAFRKIFHMSHAGPDIKVGSQEFLDGFNFRG